MATPDQEEKWRDWKPEQVAKARAAVVSTGISPERKAEIATSLAAYDAEFNSGKDDVGPDPDAGVPDGGVDDEPEPEPEAPPSLTEYTPPPTPAPKQNAPGVGESFFRGAGKSASMNLGDEASGFGAWLSDQVNGTQTARATGRGADAPVSDRSSYDVGAKGYRDDDREAELENPWAFGGGELFGLATTAALPVGKAIPAATWGARAIQAAKVASPMAALAAWGGSEDPTASGQAFDALGGAEVGALTGPLAGELTHQVLTRAQPLVRGAAEKLGNMVRRGEANRIEAAHGPAARDLAMQAADPNSAAGKAQRALVHAGESPEATEAHARAVTGDVSKIAEHQDAIQAYETIAEKARVAQKYFQQDGVDPLAVSKSADDIATEVRQSIQEMLSGVQQGTDDFRLLKRIEKEVLEYDLRPFDAAQATPLDIAGNKWGRLDQIKREIQRKLAGVKFNSPEVEALHGLEERIRTDLENPSLWGEGAADMQVRRNRAWHEMLSLEKTRDVAPRSNFLTDYRGLPSAAEHSFQPLAEGDLPGIMSTFQGAGKPEGEQALWKLGEMADRRAKLGDALTDHIDPSPVQRQRAAEMQTSAGAIRNRLGQRTQEAEASNALSRTQQNLPDPGMGARFGEWLMGMGEKATPGGSAIRQMAPAQRTLGQRARQIGQVENQLTANPSNQMASQALDRLAYKVPPIKPPSGAKLSEPSTLLNPRNYLKNPERAASLAAGRVSGEVPDLHPFLRLGQVADDLVGSPLQRTGVDLDGALDRFQESGSKSQGHQLEGTIREALAADPSVFGPYAERLKQAQSSGSIGAELLKLNADPTWRKLRTRFQAAQ